MTQKEKIKILFRHRSMEMGGVEKVMLSIINNLNSEKFDITVCLNINQGELRNEFPDHIRKVFLTEGSENLSKNIYVKKFQLLLRRKKLYTLRKNPKIVDENYLNDTYDVEIAMTYNDFEYVLNSTNKNSKKIGWFHSEINLPKLKPLVPKILSEFPLFDHMVYCSQKIKDLMHEEFPDLNFPEESVIINAIPIEEIKQKATETVHDFPDAEKVFVSVGRLHTRKGFHKLIKTHSRLIKEGYNHTIIIIGDGEEKTNLQKMIIDYSVEETFFLLGNRMNPYPYIKKADYFILPSESEAWPLVIAESLILQKPIIATNTGDVSQMIHHEKTGYLINYNVEEMYYAMKKFMTEPEYVEKIQKNLSEIEKQFDNQQIFDAVENIILKLGKK